MLQRLQIGFSTALLALSSLQAPFAHIHADADQHHATPFIHAHLKLAHHDESPEIETHDEDAIAIDIHWIPTAAKRVAVISTGTIATITAQPTLVRLGAAPDFAPRSNSPPQRLLLPARAPPTP